MTPPEDLHTNAHMGIEENIDVDDSDEVKVYDDEMDSMFGDSSFQSASPNNNLESFDNVDNVDSLNNVDNVDRLANNNNIEDAVDYIESVVLNDLNDDECVKNLTDWENVGDAVPMREEMLRNICNNFINSSRFHHSTIFCGAKGSGQGRFVKSLVQNIAYYMAENKQNCAKSLAMLAENVHSDIMFVRDTDESLEGKIDIERIRSIMDFLSLQPSFLPFKIVVIDAIESVNNNGLNAILKSMEEPARCYFFLVSNNPSALPKTILSRCNIVQMPAFSASEFKQIVESVSNNIECELKPYKAAAELCEDMKELQYNKDLATITNNDIECYAIMYHYKLMDSYNDFLQNVCSNSNNTFADNIIALKLQNNIVQQIMQLFVARFYFAATRALHMLGIKSDISHGDEFFIAQEKAGIAKYINKHHPTSLQLAYGLKQSINLFNSWKEYNLDNKHVIVCLAEIAKLNKDYFNYVINPKNRNPVQ